MIPLRVRWDGTKDATMSGVFVESHTNKVIATGAYGNDGYDVLHEDGHIETFRNAALALGQLQRPTPRTPNAKVR